MFHTIDEIKAVNKNYFSPDTMRFFNSRVYPSIYQGHYFITSECQEAFPTKRYPRRYSIRHAATGGGIVTVGDFMGYASLREAVQAIKKLTTIDTDIIALVGSVDTWCPECFVQQRLDGAYHHWQAIDSGECTTFFDAFNEEYSIIHEGSVQYAQSSEECYSLRCNVCDAELIEGEAA